MKNTFPSHLLVILAFAAFCVSCNSKQKAKAEQIPERNIKQEIQSHKGYPILVGKIDRLLLEDGTYYDWFTESYNNYQPDLTTLESIKTSIKDVDIQVFLGTWCEDSQREVPRFFKILDATGIKSDEIELIALDHHPDRYKKSPGKEEVGKQIESVPTFIFYHNETEVGRIIESPEATLEKDIAAILSNVSFE